MKIDDIWYNVNPDNARLFVQSFIKSVPFGENEVCHLNFLELDTASVDLSRIDEGQQYLWEWGDKNFETIYDTLYYFKDYLKVDYYTESAESAYAALLEKTKEQIDRNSNKVEIYLFPAYVDALWQKMQESYISDLSEKYG